MSVTLSNNLVTNFIDLRITQHHTLSYFKLVEQPGAECPRSAPYVIMVGRTAQILVSTLVIDSVIFYFTIQN